MRGTCGFPSLRQCVHASVLGCDTLDGKGIAERLGLNYQTFMSSVSGQPEHKLDADWLLPIMATTGSVEPLQFMAREMGGVFVKVKPCTVCLPYGYAHQQRQGVREYAAGVRRGYQGRTPAPRPA